MNTIDVPDTGYSFEYPSNIYELSESQYVDFLKLCIMVNGGKVGFEAFEFQMLHILLGLQFGPLSRRKDLFVENVVRLRETLCDFYTQEVDNKAINLDCFVAKLPEVVHKRIVYSSAKDLCMNLSFAEMNTLYMLLSKYQSAPAAEGISLLNLITSIVYRPAGKLSWFKKRTHTKPPAFGSYEFDLHQQQVAKLPDHVKLAALILARSTFQFLATAESIEIQNTEVNLKVIFGEQTKNPSKKGIGLTGVLFEMSEAQLFGDKEVTERTNFYDVILKLYELTLKRKSRGNNRAAGKSTAKS